MYNGIGLATPRGSGTSGYIQRNLSHVKQRRTDFPSSQIGLADSHERAPKIRKQNPELLEHERKRQIEIQIIEFSDKLEAAGMKDDDIEKMVIAERMRLLGDHISLEKSEEKTTKTPVSKPTKKK